MRRGGQCISAEYLNCEAPLQWRCGKGHEWAAKLSSVKNRGSWCPSCAPTARLSIRDAAQYAEDHGGACLSTALTNGRDPLSWRCGNGHVWDADLISMRSQGSWCPQCLHKSEADTRATFEALTGLPFPKRKGLIIGHPLWELDGYCKELEVAFEYHGKQHYECVPHFHRGGEDDFKRQQKRDAEVERLILQREPPVALIVVPYTMTKQERDEYIRKQLDLLGVISI